MTEPTLICTLRQRRTELSLSQSELAALVGVSRQALSAIEAGRQVPSTSLSLALARGLGCSVEDLFALPKGPQLRAMITTRSQRGGRVAVGRVDGRWVAHPVHQASQPGDALVVSGAPKGGVMLEPLTDVNALAENVLVAGCAPLLGLLAGRVGRRYGDARATWIAANSTEALELLERGQVHVVGLHLAEALGDHEAIVRARFPGQATAIINLTRWRQGLVVAEGNPLDIHGVEDILRPDVRFISREIGSGAEQLITRLMDGAIPRGARPQALSHTEVAQLVRWRVADVGVAIESAAIAEGLDFIPLSEERFDLVVPRARLPRVARLLDLIDAPSFRAEVARLPGYDLSTSGHAATVEAGS